MSVLPCSRRGCENIMCDRYGPIDNDYAFGYICDDCFKELITKGFGVDIKKFMKSKPKYNQELYEFNIAKDYYNNMFPKK